MIFEAGLYIPGDSSQSVTSNFQRRPSVQNTSILDQVRRESNQMAKCESLVSNSCLKALSTWATVTSTVPFSNYYEGMLATSFSAVRQSADSACGGSAPYCASANLNFEQVNRYPLERTNRVSKSASALDSCHAQFGSGHASGFVDDTGIVQMDMSFCNYEFHSQSFLLGKRQTVVAFQSRERNYPNGRTNIVGTSKLASNTSCYVTDPNISAMGSQILLRVGAQPHTCSDDQPQEGISRKTVNYEADQRQEICYCEICISGLKDLESETLYDIHGSQVRLKPSAEVDTSKYEDYSLSAVVERACCSPHCMVQQSQAQMHAEPWSNHCTLQAAEVEDVLITLQHENRLRNLHVIETRNSYEEGDGYFDVDESNFMLLRSRYHGNSVKSFVAMDQIGNSSFVANNSPGENMHLCPLYAQVGYTEHDVVATSLTSELDGAESVSHVSSWTSTSECHQVNHSFSFSNSNFEAIAITNNTTLQPIGEIEILRNTGFVVNSKSLNNDTRTSDSTSQEKNSVEQIFCGKSSVNSRGKRPAEIMKSFTPDKNYVTNEESILHDRDARPAQSLEKENQSKTIGKGFYSDRPSHPPLHECRNTIDLSNGGLELTLTDGATMEPPCRDSLTCRADLHASFAFRRSLNDSPSKSSKLAPTPGRLYVSGTKSTSKITNRYVEYGLLKETTTIHLSVGMSFVLEPKVYENVNEINHYLVVEIQQ
ncbi:hypothetical protein O6H91_Y417500 [Diphasiastrum complanatum]|nr:hypothetical protein O6H91_Y417500 [Diphasiastrum complanatum]